MNPDKNLKDYKKEPYFCNKCEMFHRYLNRGIISTTHLEHFAYKRKYKSEYTQSELFKIDFKIKWKMEASKQSKIK